MTNDHLQTQVSSDVIEHFVQRICVSLRCNKMEKQSIRLELLDHLYTAFEQYKQEGIAEVEAAYLAIAQFGDEQQLVAHYQRSVAPIYGVTRMFLITMFALYSFIVIYKLLAGRILQRIMEYINHDGPYYISYVTTNARLLDSKQFFNFNMWEHNINYIPFDTIIYYLTTTRMNQSIIIDNLLGNIVLFLPLGFLLPLIIKKVISFNRIVLIGIAVSLVVELLQFTLQIGRADIDDIILNSFGIVIGFLLAKLVLWGIVNIPFANKIKQKQI